MILKGSQRAGATQMGFHLLRSDENDHVEVHEIRGFAARNVVDALREAHAVSRGTKCTQYMFSLSLNPPVGEYLPIAAFERAINDAEERLGLQGQPRVIVFHEKEGRRHAHCVWSRIRADTMKAVNMSNYKMKLWGLARELFIEHGFRMPRGYIKSEESNPLNFSREEWQQAKRISRDPRTIKQVFQDCWAMSDSCPAFAKALQARGYYLAKGERGHVAVDWLGEVYPVSRWVGVKAKEVRARLGELEGLDSVQKVQASLRERVDARLATFRAEIKRDFEGARLALAEKRLALVKRQRSERAILKERQDGRALLEALTRANRLRKGIKGIWDRITGARSAAVRLNEQEAKASQSRDLAQREELLRQHLSERQELQRQIKAQRAAFEREVKQLLDTPTPLVILGREIALPYDRENTQRRHRSPTP